VSEIVLKIEGMSCQHCVARVKKAIDALSGIQNSEVAVGSAKVVFDESKISKEEIAAAIEKTGYKTLLP
jgi:copper chaperone